MNFSDFWLQQNSKINLQSLKEINKDDFKGINNGALIHLFNIFNVNGDDKLDKSELNALITQMQKQAATKGNNSVFDEIEANEYLANTKNKIGNKTLAQLGVKAKDLFEFLAVVSQKQNEVIAKGNNGYYVVKDKQGSLSFYNSQGKQIKEENFKKHCPNIYANVKASTTQTAKAGEKEVHKQLAQQIVNELLRATSGWNDHDAIKRALDKIDNPDVYKDVERLLAGKGYKSDKLYSPLEKFMKEEFQRIATDYSNEELEAYVQKWISAKPPIMNRAEEISAQARMAARVIIDGGDGFGTDVEKTKKGIRMIKAPAGQDKESAKEVYNQVNQLIANHKTFYGIGTKASGLIDYLKGEVWDSEIKYLKGILAENDAIQGKEKAQAVRDLTQEAASGAGTDIEYLEQAINAIKTPEDRKTVEAKLKEYCQKKGIEPKIAGQSYLQAILYDECDTFMGISTDHKEIRKFNEMLIKQGAYGKEDSEEVVALRAEQAALQILEGDFDNVKDAVEQIKDKKVLAKLEQLLKTKGYKSLDDFLSQKLNSTKSDLINAELASNNLFPNEKAADIAYRLMKSSDFDNRAMGVKAIRNEVVAKMVDERLKKDGNSLAKFMEQFNKEKAEYKSKADFWDGLGKFIPVVGSFAEDISDAYRENTDSSDNMFVEMQSAQTLTPTQKAAYQMTVRLMEQKLAQMEKDYQAALDSQGAVSQAVNQFCENYGIGTTREEIQARIEHDRETVRLLKLATDGKLGKMENGKTIAVSFEAVFKERNIGTNFDTSKVEKVSNQAQNVVLLNNIKESLSVSWDELEKAENSDDKKQLTATIYNTLKKMSNNLGMPLSLANYGYKLNNKGIIIDKSGNEVSAEVLRTIISELKAGISEILENAFGVAIETNTSIDELSDILDEAYGKKMEEFKQDYRDAFGQDAPNEMIEDYVSTINTGKIVVNTGTALGAAIMAPFTGGGSLAVFGAVAGTSFGLNALEKSTDANGYTNSEWTQDAEDALWNGALAALGMKVGAFAEAKVVPATLKFLTTKISGLFKTTVQAHKAALIGARLSGLGFEVTSDMVQAAIQQAIEKNGNMDSDEFWMAFAMSLIGNAAGYVYSSVSDIRSTNLKGKAEADVKVIPADDDTALAIVKVGATEYVVKDMDELDNIINTKAPKGAKVDYSAFGPDLIAGAGIPKSISDNYSDKSIQQLSTFLAKKTATPEVYMEAIGNITEQIKNGAVPSKSMIDETVKDIMEKLDLKGATDRKEITNILQLGISKIDELKGFVNANYLASNTISANSPGFKRKHSEFMSNLKKADGTPTDVELAQQAKKSRDEAILKARQEVEAKAQQEIEMKAKQEAELKVKQEIEAKALIEQKRLEYAKYSEKYSELKDIPFRDDDSLVKVGKAMEEYELYLKDNEINFDNFDSTEIYMRLSALTKDADVDLAFDFMKKKYHPDVIAYEAKLLGIKNKYKIEEEQVKDADKIIKQLNDMHENELPISKSDIESMISDTFGFNRTINERIMNYILENDVILKFIDDIQM